MNTKIAIAQSVTLQPWRMSISSHSRITIPTSINKSRSTNQRSIFNLTMVKCRAYHICLNNTRSNNTFQTSQRVNSNLNASTSVKYAATFWKSKNATSIHAIANSKYATVVMSFKFLRRRESAPTVLCIIRYKELKNTNKQDSKEYHLTQIRRC